MKRTKTRCFRNRGLALFASLFSLVEPAGSSVPWRFTLELGPTPAYGSLDPTPEADPNDPFIVEKATELGVDPQRIFDFVRGLDYEAYAGSLRGARGTLWSKAGNALDKASLLIALLRASGFPARYVQGTLTTVQAQGLILSMFPQRLSIVACPPDDAVRAAPDDDPRLIAEAQDHYYAEADLGAGFVPLDATVGAAIGDVVAPNQGTFDEVPDNLRHKVAVRLKVEIRGTVPSLPPDIRTVLNETFNSAELVGRSLSVGHFVNSFSPPSLVFGSITHTYAPYILIGQDDGDISDDPIIRGEDYQEFLTNFPLGSQFLTAVFLEVDVVSPGGPVETFTRALADRIGFAARRNGGPSSVGGAGNDPALGDLDLVVINALPGLQSADAIVRQQERLAPLKAELAALQPLVDAIPESGPETEQQRTALDDALDRMREITIVGAETVTMVFAGASDAAVHQLEKGYMSKAYHDSPRLLLLLTKREEDTLSVRLDIRKNDLRVVPAPGQVANIGPFFEVARGAMESALEGQVLSATTGVPGTSAFDIFSNLPDGASITLIHQENLVQMESLDLSDEAKARISQAVASGKMAVTPDRPAVVNGSPAIGWLEIDRQTGQTIAVMEDGGHQVLVEYAGISPAANVTFAVYGAVIGFSQGFSSGILTFLGEFVAGLTDDIDDSFADIVKAAKVKVENEIAKALIGLAVELRALPPGGGGDDPSRVRALFRLGREILRCFLNDVAGALEQSQVFQVEPAKILSCLVNLGISTAGASASLPPTTDIALKLAAVGGMLTALGWIDRNIPADPPVFAFLSSDLVPGTAPEGVLLQIVPDDGFTTVVDGAELPSVFKAQIQNTALTEETFNIAFSNVPAGYEARSSVSAITVPPGATAEVGLCLFPLDGLDPPGSPAPLGVTVTGTIDPAATATDDEPFVVPDIHAISLVPDPGAVNMTPDSSAAATFTVAAVGNVPEDVTIDVEVPPGLTVNGLTSPVSLGVGESASQPLTLDLAAGAPLRSTLTATITATFGPPAAQQTETTPVIVQVVTTAGQCAADAAVAASEAGRPGLASTLNELAVVLTDLSEDPGDSILQSRAVALTDSLIAQLNGAGLTPFVADFTAARDALAAAGTPADVETALNDLCGILTDLATALSGQEAFPFQVALQPNSAVALPNTPTDFGLSLENTGTQTATYSISLGPLPPGISGELSRTSVTLNPGEFIPALATGEATVTITQPVQELTAFEFTVTVSVAGAPGIVRTATGAFTAREELVEITGVEIDPSFTDPGERVNVSARLFNAVNQTREFRVFYDVIGPVGGAVFTSTPTDVELTVLSSIDTVDLGSLDTTGFELGQHTIEVTVTDRDDQPIPGAMGQGNLLIGSPVAADLVVDQEALPPCDSTLTATLQIESLTSSFPSEIGLLDVIDTAGVATSVALKKEDNLAYVCSTENIATVDITGLADLLEVGTFGDAAISGFWTTCALLNNELVVAHPIGLTTHVDVYSLGDPRLPLFSRGTSIGFPFLSGMFAGGNAAFVSTQGIGFIGAAPNDLFGDFFAFDLTDPPALADRLGTAPPLKGGDFMVTQGAAVNDHIALVPTSTAAGSLFSFDGDGRLYVVDISDPADLVILREIIFPETGQVMGVAIQGDIALVIGSSGPRRQGSPFDFLGNLVLITLDVSTPEDPVVLQILTTTNPAPGILTHPTATANGMFAVNGGVVDVSPTLLLIDASDPEDIAAMSFDIATGINDSVGMDGMLFATSSDGLTVFDLRNAAGVSVSVEVKIPTGTGVSVVPGSFDIEPTEIIPGAGLDTVVWDGLTGATTISWQLDITDLQPGGVREVVEGVTVDFTVPGGDTGQITLPPRVVVGEQVLALDPDTRIARPGEAAAYTLTLKNPAAIPVTYALSVQGVPQPWVSLAPSVTVPAEDMTDLVLTLQSDPLAAPSENGFMIAAGVDACATGFVHGTLALEGEPVGGPGDVGEDVESVALGVVLGLTPGQATAGQGTSADYVVRVTNTGTAMGDFSLSGNLPGGFSGSFDRQVVEVPPGLGDFREVLLTVTPPVGASPGNEPFTVTATSTADPSVSDQASGTVVVSGSGVEAAFTTPSGVPGDIFELVVTNTGQGQDTFDLALAGPLAPFATLGTDAVTLAPGASQTLTVTLDDVDFAFPGALDLVVVTTSQGDPAVQDAAAATVTIAATKGVDAEFAPEMVELLAPGSALFLLLVRNTGNLEDEYSATISGTSGPLTASLTGLDGQATQEVSVLRIPGTSMAALLLDTEASEAGQGAVTVTVTSRTDPAVTGTATAMVQAHRIDHFMGYRAVEEDKRTDKLPRECNVTLDDPVFDGAENFTLSAVKALYLPADKNDEAIVGGVMHLLAYKVRPARQGIGAPAGPLGREKFSRAAKHVKRTGVEVENQLGNLVLDTLREELLLVPSQKGLTAPPVPDLAGSVVDHYKCYKVKPTKRADSDQTPGGRFRKDIEATVEDQFMDGLIDRCTEGSPRNQGKLCRREETCGGESGVTAFCETVPHPVLGKAKVYDLRKPVLLCNPVSKANIDTTDEDGRGKTRITRCSVTPTTILNPPVSLVCYKVRRATRVVDPDIAARVGLPVGAKIKPKQSRHRARMPFVLNQLPNPAQVRTKTELELCLPSEIRDPGVFR